MPDAINNLKSWFETQPLWVREAATRLYLQEELSEDDYQDLLKLAKSEKGVLPAGETAPSARYPDALLAASAQSKSTVRLRCLASPVGINELSPRTPLEFRDDGITVVYGRNGSGKSGYSRILKQACSSPHAESVLPNVFSTSKSSQSCGIEYSIDAEARCLIWRPNAKQDLDLATIRILDSGACDTYVKGSHEAIFEPPILEVFTRLGDQVREALQSRLESEMGALNTATPAPPLDIQDSNIAKRVANVSSVAEMAKLDADAVLSPADLDRKKAIASSLSAPSAMAKAQEATNKIGQLEKLLLHNQTWIAELGDAKETALAGLRKVVISRKQVSDDAAKVIASPDLLPGVGDDVWKELWKYARAFSGAAYPGNPFPNISEGAKCVLCFQPLSSEAKARFKKFEEFVKSSAGLDLDKARIELKQAVDALPPVLGPSEFETLLQACGVPDGSFKDQLKLARTSAAARRQWFIDLKGERPSSTNLNHQKPIQTAIDDQKKKQADHLASSNPAKRIELENELRELKAREWLAKVIVEVRAAAERRRKRTSLGSVLPLLSTTAISTKKGQLTKQLISDAFADRVQEELTKLGADHLKVKLERQGTRYGHVPHKLVLSDSEQLVDAHSVLSEGECKVASLAVFLAHMRGDPNPVTFVFDDPSNSLDEDYEDAFVARLIELGDERQVIVFTHRISLLVKLCDAGSKDAIKTVCVSREKWGTGEPGKTPINAQKAKPALNTLRDQLHLLAKKEALEGSASIEYELKGVASEMRNCVEDLVERVLLNEVVMRYKRAIQTDGRLEKVADVNYEDCKKVEAWMAKYSPSNHSQSVGGAPALLKVDALLAEVEEMLKWIEEINLRRK